jgi:hypothetical protein
MYSKWIGGFALLSLFILSGCAKRIYDVTYDDLEKTNRVEVTLSSREKIVGTVVKAEPHQLILLVKDRKLKPVPKSSIHLIKRWPPVYDDFGRGISEDEIESVKTNRNTFIYGVGGGILSFGVSFFIGSAVAQDTAGGGSALAATTLAGGGIGTYLFVKAGQAKDRKEAIQKVRDRRRSAELEKEQEEDQTPEDLRKRLENEKKRQEDLRKQREELLKQLGEKEKEKGKKKKE